MPEVIEMQTRLTPFHLCGKRILVVGATSSLGSEIARACAEMGAVIVASGRNQESLKALMGELEGTDHEMEAFDLRNLHEIPGWMTGVAGKHGRLSGVVYCAGIHEFRPLRVVNPDTCTDLLSLNVTGAVMVAKGFRQRDVRAENASMVLVSSTAALVGQAGISIYSASKGALISLARSLAIELARDGIRVNCVVPSVVRAGMGVELEKSLGSECFKRLEEQHPLGLGSPKDVAYAAVYLLSDAARWISGTMIVLDGGHTAH